MVHITIAYEDQNREKTNESLQYTLRMKIQRARGYAIAKGVEQQNHKIDFRNKPDIEVVVMWCIFTKMTGVARVKLLKIW